VLERIAALLLDLDGVLYVEEEPIAGGVEAVERLRRAGLELRFVTNTTAHSRARTLDKLARLGFDVEGRELVTPAAIAVQYCRKRGYSHVALLMNDEVKRDFEELEEAQGAADAVIVGDLGSEFGYDILNKAFRQVMDGAELIALQKNRYWQRSDGLSLDVGPFVAALEYGTARDAYVVGKPAPGFFHGVLNEIGVAAADAAMVGDDVESDVAGALRAGLAGILVKTGKYREDAVRTSGVEPTATVATISQVPELLGL
jgi:HAD superfamily hydrolase (TIGR01458 family)